jgi:hypothetical protein
LSVPAPEGGASALSGPDLQFVEHAELPFDGRSGRVTDIDGQIWDLNVPGASRVLVSGLARHFAKALSRSASRTSRLRSNRATFYTLKGFLAYAAERPDGQQTFSTVLLKAYQTHLYRTVAAASAYGQYKTIRAAVLSLVDAGSIPRVAVPRNPNARKVAVTAKSGQTFATRFIGVIYPDANLANEALLAALRDLLWEEIEVLQRRPDLGTSMYASTCFSACAIGLLATACVNPTSVTELEIGDLRPDPRDASLRRLKFDKGRAGGEVDLPPFPVGGTNARTVPRLWERILQATASMRERAALGAATSLFLRINMTGEVVPFRDEDRIAVAMPALRKLIAGGFPTSSGRGDAATRAARTLASPNYVPSATAGQERYEAIRANRDRINYALIRNTAINVASARLQRHNGETQRAIGHERGGHALESAYLANPQYREDLDQDIRRGQTALETWVREPAKVLPPDPHAVAAGAGVDEATAARVVAEEFNLGMGASLVNGNTIVIDTPLNAMRVMQWVGKLKGAEARMRVENPDRWRSVYEPQLVLFQQALEDFSYASRQEAQKLSADIELPFPEVV